jgi:hypothetical protein
MPVCFRLDTVERREVNNRTVCDKIGQKTCGVVHQ